MRRAATALLSTAFVVPLLAACGIGGGDDQTSASATSDVTRSPEPVPDGSPETSTPDAPTTEPAPDDPADDGPAFPEGTAGQTADPSGEWDLVLTDVRTGEHDGYDRIVLEFAGTGVPGWAVDYVDEAVLDGSGEAVALGGDTFLDIYASGTTYPASEGDGYGGPRQFEPDAGDLAEVYVGGTFEGYTQVLVGLDDDPAPFRVFTLADPARLVVDVAD